MAYYPDFVESCGYGDVRGILGANCRHHFYPFIDGVSEPAYTKAELDGMKAENHVTEFEGREYNAYQATQKQRQIERTVRKYKRREAAFKAQGNDTEAKAARAKIRGLNQKYKAFSEAAGLPTQQERMKVYTPKNPVENIGRSDIIKPSPMKFESQKLLENHFKKHSGEFPGLTQAEYQKMADKFAREPVSDDLQELKRSDGSVSRYKLSTNEFIVVTKEKTIRTYFKPVDGDEYWKYERERN